MTSPASRKANDEPAPGGESTQDSRPVTRAVVGRAAARVAQTPAQRAQRKQDLLMASQMLRLHAAEALDDLSDRVDGVARRLQSIRSFFTSPWGLGALGLVGAWIARGKAKAKKKSPLSLPRLIRWAWLGWRFWRYSAGRTSQPPTV